MLVEVKAPLLQPRIKGVEGRRRAETGLLVVLADAVIPPWVSHVVIRPG